MSAPPVVCKWCGHVHVVVMGTPDELRSALQSIVSVTQSEARETGPALAAADLTASEALGGGQ